MILFSDDPPHIELPAIGVWCSDGKKNGIPGPDAGQVTLEEYTLEVLPRIKAVGSVSGSLILPLMADAARRLILYCQAKFSHW